MLLKFIEEFLMAVFLYKFQDFFRNSSNDLFRFFLKIFLQKLVEAIIWKKNYEFFRGSFGVLRRFHR